MGVASMQCTKNRVAEEIMFENILLSNGVLSQSAQDKLAKIFDDKTKETGIDTFSDYSTCDLTRISDDQEIMFDMGVHESEINKWLDQDQALSTFLEPSKESMKKVCLCFCTNSTPVRLEFDPSSRLFVEKSGCEVPFLHTFEDSVKEMKVSEDLLAETLESKAGEKLLCLPKIKKSLKQVGKSSKKGALSALTVILTTII